MLCMLWQGEKLYAYNKMEELEDICPEWTRVQTKQAPRCMFSHNCDKEYKPTSCGYYYRLTNNKNPRQIDWEGHKPE